MGIASDVGGPAAGAVTASRSPLPRFILSEAAGALGDLGTFIPIVVGMVQLVGLDAATILVLAGAMHIVSGLVFRIPIPVQPMKVICALAIAGALTAPQVGVAGLAMGGCMVALAGLGLIRRLDRLIPRPVVRGLQMTVAVKLLLSGVGLGLWQRGTGALRPLWGTEGLMLAALAFAMILVFRRRLAWAAVVLVVLGFVGGAIREPALLRGISAALWAPRWMAWDAGALSGIWEGALPQLPLTLLNSVIAVCVLAGQLFPQRGRHTTPTRVALSVGLMNLLACPLGGMPMCHGAGGLAGQHRFGARSGVSMVMLGAAKLVVGLFFGATALAWMMAFPSSVLGAFLLTAGIGLAGASQCWANRRGLLIAAAMVAVHLATGVLLLSFVAGVVTCLLVSGAGERREPCTTSAATPEK